MNQDTILTTITPYWGRPETLKHMIARISAARCPGVAHLFLFIGEPIPDWWVHKTSHFVGGAVFIDDAPGKSIGYYHNLGAKLCSSPWMMKLDLDAMPHTTYFKKLLPVIAKAKPREWFNGGMFFLNKYYSNFILGNDDSVLTEATVQQILRNPTSYTNSSYMIPQASNFICRREEYLTLGGCDERFQGWGWEDYQQLYMLDRYERGKDPLVEKVTVANVTQKCRDIIGRPKALQLLHADPSLCLLHKWHPPVEGQPGYKSNSGKNRQILLEYIQARQR